MGNVFGRALKLTIFGESHGESIGCVMDGLPPGFAVDWDRVREEMARRAPGNTDLATPRKEKDAFQVLSGMFEGKTTGAPLAMEIRNENKRSSDYSILKDTMRPGHADYTGRVKYRGFNDYRGGGHFSGRITAPLNFAGAVARQYLEQAGIGIAAHVLAIHGIRDRSFHPMGESAETLAPLRSMKIPVLEEAQGVLMEEEIRTYREKGDSVGGIIECMAQGLPVGAGDPFFDSAESEIAHMMFSVPAVKGIEFGDGFGIAGMTGSSANDPMAWGENGPEITENHNGGILGGITNGNPLLFRLAVKPTPSIGQRQRTVNMKEKKDTELSVGGRHDPCIVLRAVPVAENALAFVLLDTLMTGGLLE